MTKKRWGRLVLLVGAALASMWLLAGPAVGKKRTASFTQCVSAVVPIPDGPTTGSAATNPVASLPIFVNTPRFKKRTQSGTVTAIGSAGVRITHTDDGDLALFLVSPGGRAVALSTFRDQSGNKDDSGQPSPSGDGYGSGAESCAGSRVEFGDRFPSSIAMPGNTGLDAPITGAFTPEQPLTTFVGGPARGFWTLVVQDVQGRDVGQIDAFSLSITYSYKAKKKRKKRR
jgi:subtilisin-like proprotein convertase family protein